MKQPEAGAPRLHHWTSCCLSIWPRSTCYSSSSWCHFYQVRRPCACAFGVTCSPSVKTRVPKLHVMVGVGSPVASHVNVTCSSISVVLWLSRYVILGFTERTHIKRLHHSKMTFCQKSNTKVDILQNDNLNMACKDKFWCLSFHISCRWFCQFLDQQKCEWDFQSISIIRLEIWSNTIVLSQSLPASITIHFQCGREQREHLDKYLPFLFYFI